jgi:putative thioredoxin
MALYQNQGHPMAGPQAAFPAADVVKNATDASFMKDVMEASKTTPVIVDFWAPWCQPCLQLAPGLEAAVKAQSGKVKLVKINIDENPAYAGQLGVRSIPNVWVFDKGRPMQGFTGAIPASQIKMFVEQVANGGGGEALEEADPAAEIEQVLGEAQGLLDQHDPVGAMQLFAVVLQADPENLKAMAGMARCYLSVGQADRAKQLLEMAPADKADAPELAGVKAALDLAEDAPAGADPAKLAAQLAANAKDQAARFDLARTLAARGDLSGAVQHLIESIRIDREWNEQAARKHLLKVFDAAGQTSELTKAGRRQLSAVWLS